VLLRRRLRCGRRSSQAGGAATHEPGRRRGRAAAQAPPGRVTSAATRVTSIAIDYIDPADWIVGGRSLAEQGRSSIYFDIKVTDETNTKDDKAQYIREAFEAFARLLGDLHDESYIHVHDVRAAAYGYGGKTQEFRYQQAGRRRARPAPGKSKVVRPREESIPSKRPRSTSAGAGRICC
jgi:4-oxalocrotonate tautomerase